MMAQLERGQLMSGTKTTQQNKIESASFIHIGQFHNRRKLPTNYQLFKSRARKQNFYYEHRSVFTGRGEKSNDCPIYYTQPKLIYRMLD